MTSGARAVRWAGRLMGGAAALVALAALGPLSLLAAIGETRPGRLVGALAISSMMGLACVAALIRPGHRPWLPAVGLGTALMVAVGLAIAIVHQPPPSRFREPFGLRSQFVGPGAGSRRAGRPWVPEVDQIKLGVTLATRLVPGIGRAEARRIRDVAMRLAREVHADPAASGLGSVTHLALRELMGSSFDVGHYYAYVPPHAPGERLPAIVFLHGNGGNFQVSPWSWKPFADRHRFAIVCPTFGFGFWGPGGVEAVERARADAAESLPIDPDRVILAGISDGGNGVTRSASAHPGRYRGLLYISPTMRPDELGTPGFARAWRGRPILVLQGGRDRNVRRSAVDPAVSLLKAQGADVTYVVFPEETHFLFFGRREEVFGHVLRWCGPVATGP